MKTWELIGDYGTFVISRTVQAADEADAWAQTGIMVDLIAVGWEVVSAPDGEEWTLVEVDEGRRPMTDKDCLDALAHLLQAPEWPGASGMEDVAELVAATGRDLTEVPDREWERH